MALPGQQIGKGLAGVGAAEADSTSVLRSHLFRPVKWEVRRRDALEQLPIWHRVRGCDCVPGCGEVAVW